jgi:hypothetical protein
MRLELFNLLDSAARILLAEHPPPGRASGGESKPILLIGFEGVAEHVLLNIVGAWIRERADRRERLPITVVAPSARDQLGRLQARHPELEDACRLQALQVEFGSRVLEEVLAVTRASVAYVSLLDEADALESGLLVARGVGESVPVVVAITDEDAGVGRALRAARVPNLHAFGVLSRTVRPELLLEGTNEVLARAKHEQYVRDELDKSATPEQNASLVDWEELPDSLKESNRDFAAGVGPKLAAAGCALVPAPLIDPVGDPLLRFGDEEVEELARIEHERWATDLQRDGWRPTSGDKDPIAKRHPLLVPWDELPEEEREKDREPMRALPRMLAEIGFELYRARVSVDEEAMRR